MLALEKMREIIPFCSFSTYSPPHLVPAQKNRSQSFYIYHYLPSLQKYKSPKKKESRSTTDYLKASYTELMVLHRKYVLICACVFQFREGEFDIITQLLHSQEESEQIKQCEGGIHILKN